MPHYNLQARLWIRRALLFIAIGAALYAVTLVSIRLATHRYPGLAPDPLSYTAITETKPSVPSLKLILQPFPDHITVEALPSASALLENDGDQPAEFRSSFTASGACLVPADPAPSILVPAHQTAALTLTLRAQNCAQAPLPQSLLVSLSYIWTLQKLPGHRKAAAPESQETGRLQLPAGQGKENPPLTLNLSIHLPNNHPASHTTPGQPARSFAGLATFAPIEVSTDRERSVRRFYRLADAIAKDFTWPILLALLAYIAQVGLARRGERQQIFNAMLPILTKLILEHYLPMARRMQTVAAEAAKIDPTSAAPLPAGAGPDHPVRRTFCAILLMRRRVQHLFNSNGGIFFRSAVAEELFDACLTGFYRNFQNVTGSHENCESLALVLSPKDTMERAYTRIFSPHWAPLSTPLYQQFAAWAVDPSGARSPKLNSYLLQLFLGEAVLSFECNRIYYQTTAHAEHSAQNWYFDSPGFYFTGDAAGLPEDHPADFWKRGTFTPRRNDLEIFKLYTKYLDGMPAECIGEAKYPPH